MKALIEKAGLSLVEAVDADTRGEVTAESERIIVIGRKKCEEKF
jgi:hypothetical protein